MIFISILHQINLIAFLHGNISTCYIIIEEFRKRRNELIYKVRYTLKEYDSVLFVKIVYTLYDDNL